MESAEQTRPATRDRKLALLAVLGAWAIVVPYLGPPLGLELDVPARVEVVDHVIPGVAALLASATAWGLQRMGRAGPSDVSWLAAEGVVFLAGFWIVSTHVPLVAEAARGESPWGATLWHNSSGLPLALAALWVLLVSDRDGGRSAR